MKTLINLFDECFERFGSSILTGLFIFHAGVANILLSIRRDRVMIFSSKYIHIL